MRTSKANVVLNNAILDGGGVPGIPGDIAADYFVAQGGTQPMYAGSTQYNACHHNGKTYVVWETYDRTPDKRHTQIRAYTHSTGLWGRVYTVGPASNVEDDDHGVPAIAVNSAGRIIVVWGNHDGDFHIATSTVAEDESHWTVISNGVAGRYTYPHLVLIGTTMYCLLRLDTIPAGEFTNGAKYLVYRPITWTDATATVGAQVKIADFGDDSRWYQGNMFVTATGNRIAQVCARADYGDTFRRDVYYYEIDIANARLQQFDGGTDAFPVSRANMDANYRVRQTVAPAVLGVPSLLIEGSNTHIVFAEGETDPTVYHIIGAAGSFAAPVSVFVNTGASTLADSPRLITEASGFSMYYPTDAVDAFTRGGDVSRRLWDGDSWSSAELVMANDDARWPLGQIAFVFNPHDDLRVVFAEISETDADSAGFPQKRLYAYGDSGFIPNERVIGIEPTITGEGGWYDPSDITSLWSDTARTTQAVVDGPVRAIDDKSGNGHHLILEGSEPGTLRTDDGIFWIDMGDEFSATTSYAVTAVSLVASDAYWVTSGHRDYNLSASSHNLINLDEGSGSDRVFSIARANSGTQGNGQVNWVPFSNTGAGASFSSATNGVRGNDDFVQGLHVNGTAATAYLNGVQAGTNTVATVPDTGASRLRIGSNATLTANTYTIGRFYGAIIRSGNIDLTTRQADMTFLQSKMPL